MGKESSRTGGPTALQAHPSEMARGGSLRELLRELQTGSLLLYRLAQLVLSSQPALCQPRARICSAASWAAGFQGPSFEGHGGGS